jgi:hypothetical protein
VVRDLENKLFAAWEVESAVFDCRVSAVAENSWPYTLFAVVYEYELYAIPICNINT